MKDQDWYDRNSIAPTPTQSELDRILDELHDVRETRKGLDHRIQDLLAQKANLQFRPTIESFARHLANDLDQMPTPYTQTEARHIIRAVSDRIRQEVWRNLQKREKETETDFDTAPIAL